MTREEAKLQRRQGLAKLETICECGQPVAHQVPITLCVPELRSGHGVPRRKPVGMLPTRTLLPLCEECYRLHLEVEALQPVSEPRQGHSLLGWHSNFRL